MTLPLAAGQTAHRRLMRDVCQITRGGAPVWDPDSGTYSPPAGGAVVYEGVCRVKPATVTEQDVGDRPVVVRVYRVALDVDADQRVRVGDVLTVTSSTDRWLLARPMTVTAVELGTTRTARWVTVEDPE